MLEEEKKEQRNMMAALILICGVLFAFNKMMAPEPQRVAVPVEPAVVATEATPIEPAVQPVSAEPVQAAESEQIVPMANDFIRGSFLVRETSVDSLGLMRYRQTTEPDSPAVSLLSPEEFYTTLTWEGLETVSPQVMGETLTPETPIVLIWDNGSLRLERTVSLDNAYLMTFSDKITNKTGVPVSTALTGRIVRKADSIPSGRSTVHEGFLGLFNNREEEVRYAEIKEDKTKSVENKGGWFGITDKYWQTIFVPEQDAVSVMTFAKADDAYVSSFKMPAVIGAGETVNRTTRLFAGAKELNLINDYEAQGIPRFDLSIDFGWYYFLTKPFLYFLGWLYALVGNMGVAILIFATMIRIAMLPIATKSYESMAKMKKVQPKIKALQERYKNDRRQLQLEMMNLYKRDKVNPASGCLPMLIQIPVFFALYKVLSVSILMRQAPFFGWIHDLSQPDPSSVFTAFGYLSWPIPGFLNLGVWPILMGLTMVFQQRLSPTTITDKDQRIMMNMMPIVFTFMMGNFASGLVIYWTWSNILSIAQQKYIMKKIGV